ncbi:GDSL-type esterase/lipase family protein [Acidocella sp.]|uniref:GDSL-type esterase/lipase family protein n=1 Tax=Acidocella sp. TaxID=50710 RepID=UPI00262489CF|nr:GDSL-type esterase/lipase family protein [Acidocella sp.]
MRRWLLACALLAASGAAWAKGNIAMAPIGRMDLPWWHRQFDESRAEARADLGARIVWLGDSITYYWQRQGGHGYDDVRPVWDQYYAPYQALDFGFIGDTTASLIWRLDHGQVAGLHPRLVIILIGANNFGRVHWDAAMTVPAVEAVVKNAHQRLPGAHILLLGVLPSIRSAWVDEQTLATNAALARHYAGSAEVTFMDVGGVLEQGGKADAGLFVDPRLTPPAPALHPDAQGMRRIAEALAPVVARYVK